MNKKFLAASVAALVTISASSIASATNYIDPFSSTVGTTQGVDAFGNSWSWDSSTLTWSYSGVYGDVTNEGEGFEISFVGDAIVASGSFNGFSGSVNAGAVSFAIFPSLQFGDTFNATVTLSQAGVVPGFTADFVNASIISPPAPEPATWALMLAGFGGLGLAGYRRNRVRAA
jgi:hypothetical protein